MAILKKENAELRSKLLSSSGTTKTESVVATPVATPAAVAISTGSTAIAVPGSLSGLTNEKKYSVIMEYVTKNLSSILSQNNISATGSIGLFEFVEPNSFFISVDDGNNPTGITAFKTKVLFQYTNSLMLNVTGMFDLDYGSERYVTVRGSNPFAKSTRIRMKNPDYKGKLLEEAATATGGTISATVPTATSASTTSTVSTVIPGNVTIENVRSAYDKNKLSDTIRLATSYLQGNGNNVEVLTMRARSYYIMGNLEQAIADIKVIYDMKKDDIDCGIVNDAARAEKTLKSASGTFFTELQSAKKCKK